MENIVTCTNCGKEVSDGKYISHKLISADMSWCHCYECEEYLSTHGDKPFVAPKEEAIVLGTMGPGKKKSLTELIARLEKNKDKSDEEIRDFNEVISYFKELIKKHNISAKIVSDNLDHKYFMDELNRYADEETGLGDYCTAIIPCRVWFGFISGEIINKIFIDDRTTMKDIDFNAMKTIIECMQKSERSELNNRHWKEIKELEKQKEYLTIKEEDKFKKVIKHFNDLVYKYGKDVEVITSLTANDEYYIMEVLDSYLNSNLNNISCEDVIEDRLWLGMKDGKLETILIDRKTTMNDITEDIDKLITEKIIASGPAPQAPVSDRKRR